MPAPLPIAPPEKNAPPTAANVQRLQQWLAAITAFSPYAAGRPWLFYEELDAYLGPWGARGYLIGYGRKYCMAFATDPALAARPVSRVWVRRTLVLLQEALAELVLRRFAAGTLALLSEAELGAAAFDSHALAYTEGGLAWVLVQAPAAVMWISSIPLAEFMPWSERRAAAWRQVGQTANATLPEAGALLVLRGLRLAAAVTRFSSRSRARSTARA